MISGLESTYRRPNVCGFLKDKKEDIRRENDTDYRSECCESQVFESS